MLLQPPLKPLAEHSLNNQLFIFSTNNITAVVYETLREKKKEKKKKEKKKGPSKLTHKPQYQKFPKFVPLLTTQYKLNKASPPFKIS